MKRDGVRPVASDEWSGAHGLGDDEIPVISLPMSASSSSPIASGTPARHLATSQVAMSDDRRGAGVGAFLLAIVTAGALAHVAVRLKGLEVAYALGRERHIATDLQEERRRLQIEIGMLKDPGRVVAIARDKLKMGPPSADAIRAVGSGRPLDEPSPAAVPGEGAARPASAKVAGKTVGRTPSKTPGNTPGKTPGNTPGNTPGKTAGTPAPATGATTPATGARATGAGR